MPTRYAPRQDLDLWSGGAFLLQVSSQVAVTFLRRPVLPCRARGSWRGFAPAWPSLSPAGAGFVVGARCSPPLVRATTAAPSRWPDRTDVARSRNRLMFLRPRGGSIPACLPFLAAGTVQRDRESRDVASPRPQPSAWSAFERPVPGRKHPGPRGHGSCCNRGCPPYPACRPACDVRDSLYDPSLTPSPPAFVFPVDQPGRPRRWRVDGRA